MDPLPRTPYRLLAWESPRTNGGPLTRVLREEGYEVISALGQTDLISRMESTPYDLVLINAGDAGEELKDAITRVRGRTNPRELVPLMVAIENPDSTTASDVYHYGAHDIIVIPTVPEVLLHRVQRLLASREQHNNLLQAQDALLREHNSLVGALTRLRPRELPAIDGYSLHIRHEVSPLHSGDFFDVVALPNHRAGIVMANGMGQGAFVVANVAASMALFRSNLIEGKAPGEVLEGANRVLVNLFGPGLYATAVVAILDMAEGTLDMAAAGHFGPVIHGLDETRLHRPRLDTGPPIGVDPNAVFQSIEVQLDPGSRALFTSNGIWQQKDPSGDILGLERFDRLIRMTRAFAPDEALNYLISQVRFFADGEPHREDYSLLLFQRD